LAEGDEMLNGEQESTPARTNRHRRARIDTGRGRGGGTAGVTDATAGRKLVGHEATL